MSRIIFFLALAFHFPLGARLYFIHIPKTAGTTLRHLLEMQVDVDQIYPHRNDKKAKDLVAHDLVSGHIPYWLCRKLDPDFEKAFKVTVLREPVERYLSFLRAKKRKDSRHPDLESVMNQRFLPNNPYRWGLIDNAMCRFLADRPDLEGEELLKSAKEGLETFDCVLFFDSFTQDTANLFRRLGIDLDEEDIPKINTTEKEAVSEDLLNRVRQENLWDLKLYEYAKAHLVRKETEYQLRGASFEEILRLKNGLDYTFNQPMNGKGWSYREKSAEDSLGFPIYRWLMNEPAFIYFNLEREREYELSFSARSFSAENSIRVYVNGREVELLKTEDFPPSLYRGKIQREWMDRELTEISFHPQRSFSYNDTHRSRHLSVSFAFHRIQIN